MDQRISTDRVGQVDPLIRLALDRLSVDPQLDGLLTAQHTAGGVHGTRLNEMRLTRRRRNDILLTHDTPST